MTKGSKKNRDLLDVIEGNNKQILLFKKIIIILILIIILLSLLLWKDISTWIVFITTMLLIIYFIYSYVKKHQKITILYLVLCIIFFSYSFLYDIGSVRLRIALLGYPLKAYTVDIEENNTIKGENAKFYLPVQKINIVSGDMGYIKCNHYFIFRISEYYGY